MKNNDVNKIIHNNGCGGYDEDGEFKKRETMTNYIINDNNIIIITPLSVPLSCIRLNRVHLSLVLRVI